MPKVTCLIVSSINQSLSLANLIAPSLGCTNLLSYDVHCACAGVIMSQHVTQYIPFVPFVQGLIKPIPTMLLLPRALLTVPSNCHGVLIVFLQRKIPIMRLLPTPVPFSRLTMLAELLQICCMSSVAINIMVSGRLSTLVTSILLILRPWSVSSKLSKVVCWYLQMVLHGRFLPQQERK